MSYLNVSSGAVVSELPGAQRAGFVRRTYLTLAVAIAAFAGLTTYFLSLGWGMTALQLLQGSSWSWLIVLAAFMGVGVLADRWARSDTSRNTQMAGLGLYVVAEALIFLPLLQGAMMFAPGAIENAAVMTVALVTALTCVVFVTRKDFSFLGPALMVGGVLALGVIVCAILFEIQLGFYFSVVMVVFAAGVLLYNTSNILHTYREDQHMAAALGLFASIALMFWYLVQVFMSFVND